MNIQTTNGNYKLLGLPDICPNCHRSITPNVLYGLVNNSSLEAFLVCPDVRCKQSFIGYYHIDRGYSTGHFLNRTSQGTLIGRTFSDKVLEISPLFGTIYNQAYIAEQQNLLEICGVGYRKALEFLIKDYTIFKNQPEKENIEKMLLGRIIENYVPDVRIKSVSKRAAWLGNDETHYVRKWEGKNLEDLKKLIELTVHWIEMEVLTASFEVDMPE